MDHDDNGTQLFCICRQPYDAKAFYIACDLCQEWYHGKCINVLQADAAFIDMFVCQRCEEETGKHTQRQAIAPGVLQAKSDGTKVKITLKRKGKEVDYVGRLAQRTFAEERFGFKRLANARELTLERLKQMRFTKPLLIEERSGLGLAFPDGMDVAMVVQVLGPDYPIRVIDVATQATLEQPFTLSEWLEYLRVPPEDRPRIYNVISLEFSGTPLAELVRPPTLALQLDMLNLAWPPTATGVSRPQIQRYCLMGPAGAYTDFHIDLGGTSVWYHVIQGCKVFFLIQPTEKNLQAYEAWASSSRQHERFLGDEVDRCFCCTVQAGNTLLIPAGWIHAVHTPVDSLVVGGNFVHSLALEMQLRVYVMEAHLGIEQQFRYPNFEYLHWHLGRALADMPETALRETCSLSDFEALLATLHSWLKSRGTSDGATAPPSDVSAQQVLDELRERAASWRQAKQGRADRAGARLRTIVRPPPPPPAAEPSEGATTPTKLKLKIGFGTSRGAAATNIDELPGGDVEWVAAAKGPERHASPKRSPAHRQLGTTGDTSTPKRAAAAPPSPIQADTAVRSAPIPAANQAQKQPLNKLKPPPSSSESRKRLLKKIGLL